MEYQLVSDWERIFANINEVDDNSYFTIKKHLCNVSREETDLSIVGGMDLAYLAIKYADAVEKLDKAEEDKGWKQIIQNVLMEHKIDKKELYYGFYESISIAAQKYIDTADLSLQVTVEREELESLVISYWKVLEIYEEAYRKNFFPSSKKF